jgi:hypothetical protein
MKGFVGGIPLALLAAAAQAQAMEHTVCQDVSFIIHEPHR